MQQRGCALLLLILAGVVAAEPAPEDKAVCTIKQLILRDAANGSPIQVEQVDGGFLATMCADVKSFRAQIKQAQPLFASGKSCSLTGIPQGAVAVDGGAQKVFSLEAIATKRAGGNGKFGEVFMGHEKTPYQLTVKRLGVAGDEKECEVTRSYGAAEDCGFAPMIEKHRQATAIIKGNQPETPVVPPAPAAESIPVVTPAPPAPAPEGAECLSFEISSMLEVLRGNQCPADWTVDQVGGRGCPCDLAFVAEAEAMLTKCCHDGNTDPSCVEWNGKMNGEQGFKNFVGFVCSTSQPAGFLKVHQHVVKKTQAHF